MRINEIEVDLERAGVTFNPNTDQITAVEELAKFLNKNDPRRTAILSGSAGTGKTACTKILLAYVRQLGYRKSYATVLAAPTHKAKTVLKQLSGGVIDVITLHKLLGLRPDVNVEEFDATDIEFYEGELFSEGLEGNEDTLFILDESSMINNYLFDFILSKLLEMNPNNKILFVGDHKQLKPVKQTEISKVFTHCDLKVFLTKVERVIGGSVILEEINALRDVPAEIFTTNVNDVSGIIVHPTGKEFMYACREAFNVARIQEDSVFCKVLAFTNKRVNQFNIAVKKALKHTASLSLGGIYAGNGTYKAPYTVSKHSLAYKKYIKCRTQDVDMYESNPTIYDSADYILQYMEKTTINIPYFQEDVPAYYVELYDTVDSLINVFYVLDPELPADFYDRLGSTIENIRLRAIDKATPYKSRKTYWSMWYNINDSFTSMFPLYYSGRIIRKANLIHGYATTVHKSQGSSYNKVFVDINNINTCIDTEFRRELQYVALSRARSHIHILQ